MKHRAFTLIEAIVCTAIIVILAAILFPTFARPTPPQRVNCQSNLKQIGLGFIQYAQDYDEKFPPVAVARSGYWAGSLQPYVKGWQLFQCPSDKTAAPKTTDYYYNARLAETNWDENNAPSSTILSGEGTGDSSTSYHLSQLPDSWRTDESAPAQRHSGDANYLFTDGHAKWYAPEKITLDKPSANNPTFLLGGGQ